MKRANNIILLINGIFSLFVFIFYLIFWCKLYRSMETVGSPVPIIILGFSPAVGYISSLQKIKNTIRNDHYVASLILNFLFFIALALVLGEILKYMHEQYYWIELLFLFLGMPIIHSTSVTILFLIITATTDRINWRYIIETVASVFLIVFWIVINNRDFNNAFAAFCWLNIGVTIITFVFLFIPDKE